MEGFGSGRLVVLARRWSSLILESGSVHSVALLAVGTLACRTIGVGPIGIGSLAVQALGVLLVVKVVGMGSRREWLVRGLVGGWRLYWARWGGVRYGEGFVGSARLVVIRRMCLKVSPLSGGVVGAQGWGRNVGVPGAGVGRVRFEEAVQGGGVGDGWVCRVWRSRCLLVVSGRRGNKLLVL